MNMKIKAISLVIATLIAASAFAGRKDIKEVTIDSTNKEAKGAMGDARNSSDTTQWIGCNVTGTSGSSGYVSVRCVATDAAGTQKSCTSRDSNLIKAAYSLGDNAHITFKWDSDGNCTSINAAYYSGNTPIK